MLFGAHTHYNSISSFVSRDTFGTRTHHRAPTPQSRKPCRQKHGFLLCAGCRAAAPAQDARGSPLPGVQRRSALGRVQGDNACSESRGEAFGPRHFAGFRRKTESVIVGSYTFAESAVPSSPRAPNETHHTTKERLTIKSQAEMRGKVRKI